MRFTALELDAAGPIAEVLIRGGEGLVAELDAAAEAIRDAPGVRCVILGAKAPAWPEPDALPVDRPAQPPFRALELLPQPVIAVIEGACDGAALELALAADLRVASEEASFAMTQLAAGLVPSRGGTQRLPRVVGRSLAAEMMLLGRRLSAQEAFAAGLVNAVTPAGGAHAEARRIAEVIASRGPISIAYAKEAVLHGLDMPLEQALRYETDLTVILQTTDDRAEGVRAFLEKRDAHFEGS